MLAARTMASSQTGVRETLKTVAMGAATVAAVGGAVLTASHAACNLDVKSVLPSLWMMNPTAAPPLAVQRQLLGGEDMSGGVSNMNALCAAPSSQKIPTSPSINVSSPPASASDGLQRQHHALLQQLETAISASDTNEVVRLAREIDAVEKLQANILKDKKAPVSKRCKDKDGNKTPSRNRIGAVSESTNADDEVSSESGSTPPPREYQFRARRGAHSDAGSASGDKKRSHEAKKEKSKVKRQRQPQGQKPHLNNKSSDESESSDDESESSDDDKIPKEPLAGISGIDLLVGDIVRAQCPCYGTWHTATVASFDDRGCVNVRWHNPGRAPDGTMWQKFGDVWPSQIRLLRRKSGASNGSTSPSAECTEGAAQALPNGISGGANELPHSKPSPDLPVNMNQKVDADAVCILCFSDENPESMLLCDKCNEGHHTYCLTPKLDSIPSGPWFCSDCQTDKATI